MDWFYDLLSGQESSLNYTFYDYSIILQRERMSKHKFLKSKARSKAYWVYISS